MARIKVIEASEKLQKVLKKRFDQAQAKAEEELNPKVKEEDKEEVKQGKSWTNTGFFVHYTDAAKHRDYIIETSPGYDTKIKRCGVKQSRFKVLKRKNKELIKKIKE
jgi:acetyl-CoA carboxylase carboxyltransferase component